MKRIQVKEYLTSEKNFYGKNVCGSFYLRELLFVDDWKNRNKIEKLDRAKMSCHIHGSLLQGPHSYLCKNTCVK